MISIYKEYLKGGSNGTSINSNTLKYEIDNINAIDNKFVNNTMFRLADLLKNKLTLKHKELTDDTKKHVYIVINQLLDSILLDEFFDIFIDPMVSFHK